MTSWPTERLGALCDVKIGKTPSRARPDFWGSGSPWLSIADMNQGRELVSTTESIAERAISEGNHLQVVPGTVLMSFKLSIGKIGIARIPMYTNEAIAHLPIKNTGRLLPEYLCWALTAANLGQGADRAAMGSTLNSAKVRDITIPVPTIQEQRRIAEVLDSAEALRAKRREAIAHLDALTQSIFLDMFGDPVANPKGCPEGRHLGDVADIVSGITKGRKLNGAATREVPYLAVANVQDRRLELTTVKTIEATEAEVERYRLREGDLVLTEGGDPDKLGRGALWAEEISECIHQNHIFRVRLVVPDLTPVYLNWLVGSQRGKRYFLKSAKQTTGIATINSQQLRAFPLLIPPVSLQKEFAAAIDRIAMLREQMKASLQSLDACFASLQHRAFRGAL